MRAAVGFTAVPESKQASIENAIFFGLEDVFQAYPAHGAGCVSAGVCGGVRTRHRLYRAPDFATADTGNCFSLT